MSDPAAVLSALGVSGPPHPLLATIESAGDATDQASYEAAYRSVFAQLDALDAQLADQRFLGGAEPSAEDHRLYAVLVLFDLVFYGLYRLDVRRLSEYPNLGSWLLDLHQRDPEAVDLLAVRRAYYEGRRDLNPPGTVPLGVPDFDAPHDRDRFAPSALRAKGTEEDAGSAKAGDFVRGKSGFRGRIDAPEPGRYHVYIANNCPWCHRVALTRAVKGLQDDISLGLMYFRRDPERGWRFRPDQPGFGPDEVNGITFIRELYEAVGSKEKSVPVLWDKHERRIVSNESAEIIRMIDDAWPDRGPRLAPPELLPEIDRHNAWIWRDINNGAYKAGFAKTQAAYERGEKRFFAAFDRLERLLSTRRFVCGDRLTEADLRLYPTLFRFDPIYTTRFKLNRRFLRDYLHLPRWLDDVGAVPGVAEASNLDHCKRGYFGRHGNNMVPPGA